MQLNSYICRLRFRHLSHVTCKNQNLQIGHSSVMQWNITLHQCQSLLRYDHGNKLHTMTYFIKTKDLKYVETTNCEHH